MKSRPDFNSWIQATYIITHIHIPVMLVNELDGITEMWIEKVGDTRAVSVPVQIEPCMEYTFAETGNYKIYFKFEGTSIGGYAFYYCTAIQSIVIPEGVTSIGYYAFSYCGALESITLPSSITTIDYAAFQYCDTLETVTIPEGVTSIGGYAFYGCKALQSIVIPEGVTSIGGEAFNRCTSLEAITCKAMTAPAIQSNSFHVKSGGVLTVPTGATGYDTWSEKLGARWEKEEYNQIPSFTGEEHGMHKNITARPIKFRGKSEHGGEWLYGFLQIYQEKYSSRLCVCAVSVKTWKDAMLYSVIPDTVGQFTGLTDKMGNDIYEGDIIGCHNPDIKHLIFYNEKQGRFMAALDGNIENDFVGVCGLDDSRWNSTKEIMGNIYDNPELLGK